MLLQIQMTMELIITQFTGFYKIKAYLTTLNIKHGRVFYQIQQVTKLHSLQSPLYAPDLIEEELSNQESSCKYD